MRTLARSWPVSSLLTVPVWWNRPRAAVLSGFDPADAWALAESLRPGTALAFLLIEHGWAQPLFEAIAETGGVLGGRGLLDR